MNGFLLWEINLLILNYSAPFYKRRIYAGPGQLGNM